MRRLLLGVCFLAWACAQSPGPSSVLSPEPVPVLLFTRTAGFRHDSIPLAVDAITRAGEKKGLSVESTEDGAAFTEENLSRFRAVVFLNTTGDVLSDSEQRAFEQYLQSGGGFAGIHSATDTEYEWAWYGGLVGAYFKNHSAVQPATIKIADRAHPSTSGLPESWVRTDEWYNFRTSPTGVHILALLDESTYAGGDHGADHPIAWCHEYGGGRAWYTGGGHTSESFREPLFLEHVLGGISWASGLAKASCGSARDGEASIHRSTDPPIHRSTDPPIRRG